MDYTCRTKTLQSLSKDMQSGRILLQHKLQRKEGQWKTCQKSDLIDSLLRKYPINPSYGIKEDDAISIIDGVQRLSTIRDYLDNKFALSKDLDPVIVNGSTKEIAGKKFKKLDEETQDTIKDAELQIYELIDCTEKDVREMFRRQNAGKALNNKQLRVVYESDEFSEVIYSLTAHPLMRKLTTHVQCKNGTDRDLIIQTLMLIMTNQENDFTSFRTKDINNFIMTQSNECIKKVDVLKEAMNKLNESFSEIKVKQLNVPMILFVSYRCIKDKKSFAKLTDRIKQFISDYNDENKLQEYKKFCLSGTASSENVRGRLDYWRKIIREL